MFLLINAVTVAVAVNLILLIFL